jgi:hypothetical protein
MPVRVRAAARSAPSCERRRAGVVRVVRPRARGALRAALLATDARSRWPADGIRSREPQCDGNARAPGRSGRVTRVDDRRRHGRRSFLQHSTHGARCGLAGRDSPCSIRARRGRRSRSTRRARGRGTGRSPAGHACDAAVTCRAGAPGGRRGRLVSARRITVAHAPARHDSSCVVRGGCRIWRIDGAGGHAGWPVAMIGGPWAIAPDPWGAIASWKSTAGGPTCVRSASARRRGRQPRESWRRRRSIGARPSAPEPAAGVAARHADDRVEARCSTSRALVRGLDRHVLPAGEHACLGRERCAWRPVPAGIYHLAVRGRSRTTVGSCACHGAEVIFV